MAGASIILTTLNARYSHAALGLRYLLANMGPLADATVLREFTINDAPAAITEALLAASPRIIGFGIYIWNLRETTRVVQLIKAVAPQTKIVLGGPEISYEHDREPISRLADVVLTGEADLMFAAVCQRLLAGEAVERVMVCAKPDLALVRLPYHLYDAQDLAHRLIYVEASRGCPFTCEFCLSSIEDGVRSFPLEAFLAQMRELIARGCRTFKFVDRTFNLSPKTSARILEFFRDHYCEGMFLHFELVPDRLPEALKSLISGFPPGAVQFEIGIQSFTPAVGALISRRMDRARTVENLTWLARHSGVHVHADLIFGLPGETMASLAESFDALWFLQPGEIQLGILKLLKGTPLGCHREAFAMVYNPEPPYDLLHSRDFDFPTMQRLKRFARYFELYANSGRFTTTLELVIQRSGGGPFIGLMRLSDWLWATSGREHGFSLKHLYELIGTYLEEVLPQDPPGSAAAAQASDLPGVSAGIACLARDFLATRGNPAGSLKGLPDFMRLAVESLQRQSRLASPASATAPGAGRYRLAAPGGFSHGSTS